MNTEPTRSKLPELLAAAAQHMRADFEFSSVLKHDSAKGFAREAALVTSFLEQYAPSSIEVVHGGEAITTTGQHSGQCDVMFVDRSAPRLGTMTHRLVPIECLHGMVEVKSTLTAQELAKADKLIATTKGLPKTAYWEEGPFRSKFGGNNAPIWKQPPTLGMVFAYDSSSLESIGDTLANLIKARPVGERIDSIWILNKGYFRWTDHGFRGHSPTALPTGHFEAEHATQEQVLMNMLVHLTTHFGHIPMPAFNFSRYTTAMPRNPIKCWSLNDPTHE